MRTLSIGRGRPRLIFVESWSLWGPPRACYRAIVVEDRQHSASEHEPLYQTRVQDSGQQCQVKLHRNRIAEAHAPMRSSDLYWIGSLMSWTATGTAPSRSAMARATFRI